MEKDFEREMRRQRRYEQIGTSTPRCPDCPEEDWRCFTATSMPRCTELLDKGEQAEQSRLETTSP